MIVALLVLPGCTKGGQESTDVVVVPQTEGCDNLNDLYCSLPFPSDRYLTADASSNTGYRLTYTPQVVAPNKDGVGGETMDFTLYEQLDGVSPSSRIMTMFDDAADLSAAATQDTIERSLEADSPTVLVDLTTGEHIAHWVENDARAESPDQTVLYLNPATRLLGNHAYAVALRGLSSADGSLLAARPAFAAIRDGNHTDAPDVEARWDAYQSMFATLESANVPRADLQGAWQFHTASDETIRRDLLAMRDDALERVGEGLGCTVTSIEDDYASDTEWPSYRRVQGTFIVPSYMDGHGPGHHLVRDSAGIPVYQGEDTAPFTLLIPYSLTQPGHSGRLVLFGHGLLSTADNAVADTMMRYLAERTEMVVLGTDWSGMSDEDVPTVAAALVDFNDFTLTTDRLHQGMINALTLNRTFTGVCSAIPEITVDGVSVIDPSQTYFAGGSLGGILGGTLLTISPDIERGALLVNGAVFPFMIERSIDFAEFDPLFTTWYPNRIDRAAILPLTQHLWDHTEPNAWLPVLTSGSDATAPKKVLSVVVNNDQQVNNLASDLAARMMQLPVVRGSTREPWGLPIVDAPFDGSGYVTLDLGDRPPPTTNVAADFNDNGHSTICWEESCIQMLDAFLRPGGQVTMPCDGPCDPD